MSSITAELQRYGSLSEAHNALMHTRYFHLRRNMRNKFFALKAPQVVFYVCWLKYVRLFVQRETAREHFHGKIVFFLIFLLSTAQIARKKRNFISSASQHSKLSAEEKKARRIINRSAFCSSHLCFAFIWIRKGMQEILSSRSLPLAQIEVESLSRMMINQLHCQV